MFIMMLRNVWSIFRTKQKARLSRKQNRFTINYTDIPQTSLAEINDSNNDKRIKNELDAKFGRFHVLLLFVVQEYFIYAANL